MYRKRRPELDCTKSGTKTAETTETEREEARDTRRGRKESRPSPGKKVEEMREGTIKNRKIGSEAPVRNRNQGPLEVSLRPERGVVGSETPHRARGVWRPGRLASQTERRGTRKNFGENPEGKAGTEWLPPQGRQAGQQHCYLLDIRQKQAPQHRTGTQLHLLSRKNRGAGQRTYNGGGARDIVRGVGTETLRGQSLYSFPP